MKPHLRKLVLVGHVASSVGWLGALAAFLALAIIGLLDSELSRVHAAYLAMDMVTRYVIAPLAAASLATGVIQSLISPWGLVRHYWIVAKLVLTIIATAILVMKMNAIAMLADAAVSGHVRGLEGLQLSLLIHAIGGLFILLSALALAIYKPAGLTSRDRRPSGSAVAPAPPWVRGAKLAGIVIVTAVGIMVLVGGHGPGSHLHGMH